MTMYRFRFLWVWFCFLTVAGGHTKPFAGTHRAAIVSPEIVHQKWSLLFSRIKELADAGVKMLLPRLMENMDNVNISFNCIHESMKIIRGIRKLQPWAVKFVDASAKTIDGIFGITTTSLGNYDECVNNVVMDDRPGRSNSEKILFRGSYCRIHMKPYLPEKISANKYVDMNELLKNISYKGTILERVLNKHNFLYLASLSLGICVPSGCSKNDLNQILDKVADYLGIVALATRCETKEQKKITPVMIAAMSIYSFAGFLLFLGSMTEIICYYTGKKLTGTGYRVLISFSFISNFKKLTDTSTASSQLSCLHGLRFLSMSWIIIGHTYMLLISVMHSIPEDYEEYLQAFPFQVIFNATVAVDTFFFITGMLVCYAVTKLVKIQKRNFSVPVYLIHRLWKILPVYAFVITFMFILPLFMSGPLAHEISGHFIQACEKNWWANLLFINNYYDAETMCLPHGWYLALDMQYYFGALIILLPLMRSEKLGMGIALCIIGVGMVSSGIYNHVYSLPPAFSLNMNMADADPVGGKGYRMPQTHASVYCIGIISGYLLAMYPKLRIPKVIQPIGWCVAFALCMSAVYGPYKWNNGVEPTFWETMMFSSCSRTAWTLGISWMVICCCTGRGGFINHILSWKVWIPLGRLCFLAYLIHPLVVLSYLSNLRSAVAIWHHYIVVWAYIGHLVITFAVAFAATLLVEAPLMSLEKVILSNYEDNSKVLTENIDCEHDRKSIESDATVTVISLNGTTETLKGMDGAQIANKF